MSEVNLPEGWLSTKLGSIIELKYGKSLPAKTRDGGIYPVYGSNGIVGGHSEPLINNAGIIIGRKGSYGEVQLSSSPFFPIDTTYFVDEIYDQPLKYWFYQLRNLPLTELNRSTAIPGLNREDAYNQKIALPPLTEQKVIADKLDTLLAQVESAKARLERISGILKRFRQSVLAAAVSGNLTKEWRKENKYPHDMLQSILKEKKAWIKNNSEHNEVKRVSKRVKGYLGGTSLAEMDLPENWAWSQLEDCVLMIVDCHNKTAPYTESGNPLIRTSNIRDGKFIWENLKFVSDETYEYWSRRCPPEPGDIIFTREAPMGEAAIIPPNKKLCLGQRTMLIRPIEQYLSAKYLLMSLMDSNFRKRSEELAVGTGVKHFRVGDVSNLVIAVPPTEEQVEIVRRVDKLFAFADSIEQKANAALERVNNLAQSILAKAFRGELTADWRAANPDLISGENSAEALLKKIQAEREAIKKQPKPKRRVAKKKTGSRMNKQIIKVAEALRQAGKPLSGQELLVAAGYASDSSTELLEKFFLDIRDALNVERSIVKLARDDGSQDWFTLAEVTTNE
jgi:type I restriction enzyme S subunit